jgi:stage II sporulation protein R
MIKEIGNLQHIQKLFKTGFVLVLTVITVFAMFAGSYSESVNTGLSDSLIRLHVIANSDSPQDQSLKRDVRDAVIVYMKNALKDSKSVAQTSAIINNSMNDIKNIAADVIKKEGKNYSVDVKFGDSNFPTKLYGDIALPAGTYRALRVIIGKGEGANWWCVLFPPLCFVDATHGSVPDSVKNELRSVLTEDEYNLINSVDSDEEIPIKIKFKIVEVFENSKIRFAGVLNKIFSVKK